MRTESLMPPASHASRQPTLVLPSWPSFQSANLVLGRIISIRDCMTQGGQVRQRPGCGHGGGMRRRSGVHRWDSRLRWPSRNVSSGGDASPNAAHDFGWLALGVVVW